MRQEVYTALAVPAALGLLALVVWYAGPGETLDILARLEVWQGVVLVATAFGVSAFTALAWKAILGCYGHGISAWLLFRLTTLAFAAGWLVPSGFVASIPVAAVFLRRKGVPFSRGMASFGISRFLEITAYALILPLALLSDLGSRHAVQLLTVGAMAAVVLVYLDLILRWQLARRTLRALARELPRASARPLEAAIGFCTEVAGFFHGSPGTIVLATVCSFAAIGMALVRALLTNVFLDLHMTTPEVVVVFAITIFLMAVPVLPGAIGAYEGGIAGAFELMHRSRADGLAYAVTVHATELAVVAVGLVVLAHLGFGLLARAPVAADATTVRRAPRPTPHRRSRRRATR